MGDSNEVDVSARFNAGVASAIRLHKLLEDCNECSRSATVDGMEVRYLRGWFDTLKVVSREINPKLKTSERTEIMDLFSKFRTIKTPLVDNIKSQEGNWTEINTRGFYIRLKFCDDIEKQLRNLADKKGLLIPDKEVIDEMPEDW